MFSFFKIFVAKVFFIIFILTPVNIFGADNTISQWTYQK